MVTYPTYSYGVNLRIERKTQHARTAHKHTTKNTQIHKPTKNKLYDNFLDIQMFFFLGGGGVTLIIMV
jgi:hypothetical protein